MSMGGTPKAIARKAHVKAVAEARARYKEAIIPAGVVYAQTIAPLQQELTKAIETADADYFAALEARKQPVTA